MMVRTPSGRKERQRRERTKIMGTDLTVVAVVETSESAE